MGFFGGLLVGCLFGVTIFALLKFFMGWRSLQRQRRRWLVANMACVNLSALKSICGNELPKWVSFPEFERVKWLNKEIKKIWPFLSKAVATVVREAIEPQLEQYRPLGVTSLKLKKLNLGRVPPQIGGVRFHKEKSGQLILDLDLKWTGDPSIILNVATLAVSVPVQLKNLKVATTMRLILQITPEAPCVAAVVIALLDKPQPAISYTLKAVGGSLTALPGIQDIIRETVMGTLNDTLVWPKRIVVPIIPGFDTSPMELQLNGCLRVKVVSATGVKNVDLIGLSDPYVVLWTRPLFQARTRVIDDDLNPVWNENFDLDVEEKMSTELILRVMDKGVVHDGKLGYATFKLSTLQPEETTRITLFLRPEMDTDKFPASHNHGIGTINIELLYHEYNPEEREFVTQTAKDLEAAKKKGKVQQGGIGGAAQMAAQQVLGMPGSAATLVGQTVLSAGGVVGKSVLTAGGILGNTVGGVGRVLRRSKTRGFVGASRESFGRYSLRKTHSAFGRDGDLRPAC